jgi:hypothetical protein
MGRTGWSAPQWELETEDGDVVGIVVFGLVPEFVRKRFGATTRSHTPGARTPLIFRSTASASSAQTVRMCTGQGSYCAAGRVVDVGQRVRRTGQT